MKLKSIKKSELPAKRVRKSEYKQVLEAFVNSDSEAAKLEELPAKSGSAAAQLRRYVNKDKLPVSVRVAGHDVYLVRGE